MACSFAYPPTVPIDCVQEIISIVRAGSYQNSAKELAHAAWTVQGYLQNVLLGSPSPVVASIPPAAEARDAFSQMHAELSSLVNSPKAAAALPDPLLYLIKQYLLPLLAALLSQWLGS